LNNSICKHICLAIAFAVACPAWADKVVTRGGKSIEGKIQLSDNALKIDGLKIAITEIKSATIDLPAAPPLPDEFSRHTAGMWAFENAGALCWDGSFIARKVVAVDDTKVTFENSPREFFLSTVNTAAIFFGRVSLGQINRLRSQKKSGVLLASGGFVEGELKAVADGVVVVDSILFGRKSYPIGSEAISLWLRKPRLLAARFTVSTRDGSVLLVKNPVFRNDGVTLNGSPFRNYQIALKELVEIRNGNAVDLLSAAWARVDAAPPEKKPLLLANVKNVDRSLQLQQMMKLKKAELNEARQLLTMADANRNKMGGQRGRIQLNMNRTRNVWQQRNREFFRLRGNGLRMNAQARTSLKNLQRLEKSVVGAERDIENQMRKLADLGRKMDRAKDNPKLTEKYRRWLDEAKRTLDRAKKSLDRIRAQAERARGEHAKKFAAVKPLTLREQEAKQLLEKAKLEIDAAQKTQATALAEWRLTLRKSPQLRRRVAQLQREYNTLAGELESLMPRIPEIDFPR